MQENRHSPHFYGADIYFLLLQETEGLYTLDTYIYLCYETLMVFISLAPDDFPGLLIFLHVHIEQMRFWIKTFTWKKGALFTLFENLNKKWQRFIKQQETLTV